MALAVTMYMPAGRHTRASPLSPVHTLRMMASVSGSCAAPEPLSADRHVRAPIGRAQTGARLGAPKAEGTRHAQTAARGCARAGDAPG